MFSALLPTTDVIRRRSSWVISITARAVGYPAEGKVLRPQQSPRVVFFCFSAFSSRRAKSIIGDAASWRATDDASPGASGPPRAFEAAATSTSTAQVEITSLRAAPRREGPLQEEAAGERTSPADFPPIPCRGSGRYRTSPWRHPAGRPGRPSRPPKYGRKRPCRRHPARRYYYGSTVTTVCCLRPQRLLKITAISKRQFALFSTSI